MSIVTPSFRNSEWLRLCIASVADQGGDFEHIVQDAGSDDGTLDWLPHDPRVKLFVEKDQGMYDALNRGFARAGGDILAYLNCDEQYLPGTLLAVSDYFQRYPRVEVAFGNVVIIAADGSYLWHRKVQTPLKYHTWTCHLSTLSCAMFFRRGVFFERGMKFDPKLRDVGDGEWIVRLLRNAVPMGVLNQFTSAFTRTGANMSAGANARRENLELRQSAPVWARLLRPAFIAQHRVRRLAGGMYSQKPFAYEVFTLAEPGSRKCFQADSPVYRQRETKPVGR